MKKIFILTGEPSGDKLASEVIKNIKNSRSDIDYLCVGGKHLNSIGVESSTSTFTTLPDTSDSISLNNFIASIIQIVSPSLITSPTFTKGDASGEEDL